MTRLLVVGGNGQVGRELRRSLATLGEVVATSRDGRLDALDGAAPVAGIAADLADTAALVAQIRELAPAAVVNAAAYTAVDKAEADVEAAFRINAQAPGALARACADLDIPFVHYSTDYVFDGQGTRPYREDDPTAPLGVYGASKLAGEEAVRAAGGRHFIFRTAWVYATHGHNFLRTMLRLGAEREELRVVADQVGTPTPAALIADVTALALGKALADAAVAGTWHLVAAGETSWHGFARFVIAQAQRQGLTLRARPEAIEAIPTSAWPTPAQRPHNSRLDTGKLRQAFNLRLPTWETGVERMLSEILAKEQR